jgi:hypothetical protein
MTRDGGLVSETAGALELGTKSLENTRVCLILKECLKDVEGRSDVGVGPRQRRLLKEALQERMFEKLDPAAYKVHEKNYRLQRDHLIAEWERETGQRWPRHSKFMLNTEGDLHHLAGSRHQAHHLIPQQFGGPQQWWNLHPLSAENHQGGVHGKSAPLTQLLKSLKK